jgi:hypothetical protein
MSHEYATALEKARKAAAAYRLASEAYLARQLTDDEYFEAVAAYRKSDVECDAAFTAEQNRSEA